MNDTNVSDTNVRKLAHNRTERRRVKREKDLFRIITELYGIHPKKSKSEILQAVIAFKKSIHVTTYVSVHQPCIYCTSPNHPFEEVDSSEVPFGGAMLPEYVADANSSAL